MNGSVLYQCEFVLDSPIKECYVELKNLASGEITVSHAKNDAHDSIAFNTTENLCDGNYTAVCYYVEYNNASKKVCSLENITVEITGSNKTCSSSSIPMPTHTTSYPPSTPTPSPPNCKSFCNFFVKTDISCTSW